MSKMEKYRLFAATTRNDTMRTALDETYSKASGTHILIYKKGKCPAGFKEIKEPDIHLLPSADREWLREVNLVILKAFEKKYAEEEEKANKKFLNDFEKELESERRKLQEQGGG